jgi:hypothetical protein
VLIGVAVLAGCTVDQGTPVAPSAAHTLNAAASDTTTGTVPMAIAPRFDIGLDVEGSLKPGHPIHLIVRGQANFATADGEIRLTLPEVAAARRSGWDVVEVPVGEEMTPLYQTRRSFEAREQFRERATVTIPEPGYYSVHVTARQHSDDRPTDGGSMVGSGAARELWLWVDEHGGRVTERFDPSLFPAGTRKVRGPLGSERMPPRIRDGGSYITCTIYPEEPILVLSLCPGTGGEVVVPPTGTNALAGVSVTYKDLGTEAVRPLPDAFVAWKVVSISTKAVAATGSGYLSASGQSPVIDCKGPTSDRTVEVTVHTRNSKAEVKSYLTSNPDRTLVAQFYGPCGGSISMTADNHQAHLFHNLNRNWDGHLRVFGTSPPTTIRAGLYPPSNLGTRYDWGASDIHIETEFFDHIWREMGVLVAAHEWGHLWQDQYLYQAPASNGLRRFYGTCPWRHPPGNGTTFGCALGEAFADWYAVLIREGDLPTWRRDLEENTNHLFRCQAVCGDDGSIVQGAIHAFLWDITDAAFTENFDRVQKPAIDVVNAIRGCEVAVDWADFKPYTGVDHLIWCMERRFPYQVRMQYGAGEQVYDFFPRRSKGDWAKEARGPMVNAFNDDFRRLWLVNLYSKRTYVGQTPIFRTILASEDPSIQQPTAPAEPTDSVCTRTGTAITCPVS